MKARSNLSRFSELALRQRWQGLTQLRPPFSQVPRGSLAERHVTCGNPACRRARGGRRGPVWYLTVTLGSGHTAGVIVSPDQVKEVQGWIEDYHSLLDMARFEWYS